MKSLSELYDYTIYTADKKKASITNFIFDIRNWRVTFLKVNFGNFLSTDMAFLSKELIREIDHRKKEILLQTTYTSSAIDPEKNGNHFNFNELKGFQLVGIDMEIGFVEDLIIDDAWNIGYVISDSNWKIPGGKKKAVARQQFGELFPLSDEMQINATYDECKELSELNALYM